MKVAIVIPVYGKIDEYLLMNINKIHNDLKYSNHTKDTYDVVLMYDEDSILNLDIFKPYNYTLIPYSENIFKKYHFHVINSPHKYNTKMSKEWTSSMWYYNCLYILPSFYLLHMEYDKYWYMENDVYYSGNYFDYFNDFSNRDYDFMTCGFHKNSKPTNESLVQGRTFLTTIQFDKNELYACLNTLCMFTNEALHTLIGCYWTGNDMYFEQLYASLMKKSGYKYGDSLDNIAKFSEKYVNDKKLLTFRNQDISIAYDELTYEKTLYHPIKDFSMIYAPYFWYAKVVEAKNKNTNTDKKA